MVMNIYVFEKKKKHLFRRWCVYVFKRWLLAVNTHLFGKRSHHCLCMCAIINAVEIYGVGKQLPYGVCICTVKRQCNFRKTVFAVARWCVYLYRVYHNQW